MSVPGHGCSSTAYGLGEEVGPFYVEKDGKIMYWNPYFWNLGLQAPGRYQSLTELDITVPDNLTGWMLGVRPALDRQVSSNETSSAALTLGYEQVATVRPGRISKTWSAPCFAQNAARLEISIISGTSIGSVYIMPHNGKCWSCRDDYQIRLGDEIMSTGSVYFGAVEAPFLFAYMTTDQRERIQKEGMKIFVDKNAACNGVSRKTMKNPFGDMEFVAMN
ncbi:unnamed protein product [Cuscuta campestris]|uniref:Uncharacterized protein n=1 Tax=Cuscuta campestris TaxID=132261 RepID=A0A484NP57_9ASTE|nr:unnamed protein product [Cuscuta campestris]